MNDSVGRESVEPELLTTTVITKVAERKGVDPLELSPSLHTAIDTDAIESLFSPERDGFVRIEFTYHGYTVTIEGDTEPQVTVE